MSKQAIKDLEESQQKLLLTEFLSHIKQMTSDLAQLHLSNVPNRNDIIQPKVFISYAWEDTNTSKLKSENLCTLLTYFKNNLLSAGLEPWIDRERMTGEIKPQMHKNMKESHYAVLIGTNRYAERTQETSNTNVREELDYALKKAKKKK